MTYSPHKSATPANSNDIEDADLRRLVEAWPRLPDPVRAGILAMIDATGGTRG